MAYSEHEEEQIEALKKWWKENGSSVVIGISIGLALLGGWRFWQSHTQGLAEQASTLYEQVMQQEDAGKMHDLAQQLLREYPDSSYAALASLKLAGKSVEDGNLDAALSRLQWIVDNSKSAEIKTIAVLRKVRLLIAKAEYDSASALLESTEAVGFRSLYEELKGDILRLQGKPEQAKSAYAKALAELPATSPHRADLQMKHDDLGVYKQEQLVIGALAEGEELPAPGAKADESAAPPALETAVEEKVPEQENKPGSPAESSAETAVPDNTAEAAPPDNTDEQTETTAADKTPPAPAAETTQ